MYIKSVSSCPLVRSPTSELWVPDETKREVFPLSRRKFIKFIGTGAIGFTVFSAVDSLLPQRAEAQWGRVLIPAFLTGLRLVDLLVKRKEKNELGMFLSLTNDQSQHQEGNVEIRIVTIKDRPIYNNFQVIDNGVPPLTERTYELAGIPCGPYGKNIAFGSTALNELSQQYEVI